MKWMGQASRVNVDVELDGVLKDSDEVSPNDIGCDGPGTNEFSFQTNADALLQLDDEALFGIIKKLACNGLRQILSGSVGTNVGTSSNPFVGPGLDTCREDVAVGQTVTRINSSFFSEVIDKLSPEKKLVIKAYGFESLLSFGKCDIPLQFSWWLADHVQVQSSEIVVNNRCISLSPQMVHDVLGIPIGGLTITNAKSGTSKHGFLSLMGLDSLPSARACADNLLNDGLSDDNFVRNFLIIAMVTFLCPDSNNYPSAKYLEPLIDVKNAKEWDWSEFVHCWMMNEINQYNLLKKKAESSSVTLGGCLYLICVVYLDFLDFKREPLPSILPRIKVWKGDMIKEYSDLDCVEGHLYGKHHILQFNCTCYAKRNSARTAPPPYNIDGSNFKKILAESVCAPLSPQTLDDITALYLKNATSPNEGVPIHVQRTILDLINYFYDRAQTDKCIKDGSDFVPAANAKESEAVDGDAPTSHNNYNGHVLVIDVPCDGVKSQTARSEGFIVDFHDKTSVGNNVVDIVDGNAPSYDNGCHPAVRTSEGAVENVDFLPKDNELHDGNTILPAVGNENCTTSSHTLLLPSYGDNSCSVEASIADTEIISSTSHTLSDSVVSSQGGSLLKRKRISSPITSLNFEVLGSHVAERTRSRRLSLSPMLVAEEPAIVDNPEAILRKKNKTVISTKMKRICQSIKSAHNRIEARDDCVSQKDTLSRHLRATDHENTESSRPSSNDGTSDYHVFAKVTQNKSAYIECEDISVRKFRDLKPPSVNVCHEGTSLVAGSSQASEFCQARVGLPNSTIPSAGKDNIWDFCGPTFNLLDELDGSSYDASHNKDASNVPVDKVPIYDETPPSSTHEDQECASDAVPPVALDVVGNVLVVSSQESPDVHVTGHRFCDNESEVVITGERQFIDSCNIMAREAEKIYDASDVSCFDKCQKIGFNLGSSSKGEIGKSHRPRRILQPNSYFRDFQVNVCSTRFPVALPEKQVYECVLFYSQFPQRARDQVINYDNVRVTFEELGSSMRRCEKTYVHNHVINAFCRKLFKDKHPKQSRRHYFFSPVGDYLMNHHHEGNISYLHDNCEKCFKLANGSQNFKSSDYLFFPIFHETHWFVFVVALRDGYFVFLDSFFDEESLYQKTVRDILIPNFIKAWDEFVQCDWNFHEFVVHYAPVPQQDRKFFSKFDDGIFVMKFLELWDPCINMMVQFSSSHIHDIRILLVNSMIFSKHNSCNDAKNLVFDHQTMLALRRSSSNQPLSLF